MTINGPSLPLGGRMLLASIAAFFCAAISVLVFGLQNELHILQDELRKDLDEQHYAITTMVGRAAEQGNRTQLQEIIEHIASNEHIGTVRYRDTAGLELVATNDPSPVAPAWFKSLTAVKQITYPVAIDLNSGAKVALEIVITDIAATNHLWFHMQQHLLLLAIALALEIIAIYAIVRRGIRPMRSLVNLAHDIQHGDLKSRLEPYGAPEFRRLIVALNSMAAAIGNSNTSIALERDRFKGLTRLSSDWYWEQDENLTFAVMSPGICGSGFDHRDFIGKSRWELPIVLPADEMGAHRARLAAHEPFRLEYQIHNPFGEKRWFHIRGEPIFVDGAFKGYRGIGSDITDARVTAERLNLAASVFQCAHDGIAITDVTGVFVDVNPAFERLTGYTREEAIGKTPAMLRSGRQSEEFYESMWHALFTHGHWKGELWNRKKEGSLFAELLTVSAVRDPKGKITNFIGIFSDITMLKQHQQHLEVVASHDALTQLPNRTRLNENMRLALAGAARSQTMVAVCYIDLDGFKPVNDTYGHAAGDHLLVTVAQRLKACVRANDTVARLGGDEFVVLVTGLESRAECKKAVKRILGEIDKPYSLSDHCSVRVTASIGIALYPQDDGDADALLRHADQAMYLAKQQGKNRYQIFDPETSRENDERTKLLTRFAVAIDNNELVLFYQPKVDMQTGEVVGLEALIRWHHPDQGLLPPAEFLPAVENSPAAIRMGYWVIENTLRQLSEWMSAGIALPVSVNVPGQLLLHENFLQKVRLFLSKYPEVGGRMLQMEVLESVALENIELASATIRECKSFGITFALDDFGTGYSSMTYLKRLAIDVLKIDQSFVRNMLIDAEDLAIVEGVASLSGSFSKAAVAEGVETIEHGAMLLRLGCRYGQGYGIARPMSARDIPMWVEGWHLPDAWQGVRQWGRENIPLLEAEVNHRRWIHGIEQLVSNPDSGPIQIDAADECRFAGWMASVSARRFHTHARFPDVARVHREVHRRGREIADMIAEGRIEHARVELVSLHCHRDQFIGLIYELAGEESPISEEVASIRIVGD